MLSTCEVLDILESLRNGDLTDAEAERLIADLIKIAAYRLRLAEIAGQRRPRIRVRQTKLIA